MIFFNNFGNTNAGRLIFVPKCSKSNAHCKKAIKKHHNILSFLDNL